MLALLIACAQGPAVLHDDGWLGSPYPADGVDLADFPSVDEPLGRVLDGWAWRADLASHGFALNGPIYFPLDGPLDVPETTDGLPDDPVLLVDLDTGELLPLQLRFIDDALDDPYLVDNLLQILPQMGHVPRSGATMAAVLMDGVQREDVPEQVEAALELAGVPGRARAATVFTVQDVTAEHRALIDDVDDRLDAQDWPDITLRRVVSLTYETRETPGGRTATACIAEFQDGSTDIGWLARETEEPQVLDLVDWPVAVYQAEIPLLNYSGLDDQPYMSPGVQHLTDVDLDTGWIRFQDGSLVTQPDQETVRVVVQVPLDLQDQPNVLVWDHGTGGTAYNIVKRRRAEDLGERTAQIFADTNTVVISHDQPLYGQRYDQLDNGFTDGWLGFYNIVNLTAMRDNHRQAGLEGHQLRRWAVEALAPELGVEMGALGRGGHSLGGATANNGVVSDPDGWDGALISGGAGYFALSFLQTGLVGTDSALVGDLANLFEVELDPDAGIGVLVAAGLGIDDPVAQQRVDRMHPSVMLFQQIMDPADPIAFARDETLPVTLLLGVGDYQVPNAGTRALSQALPDSTLVECTVAGDYDPHYCLYRDEPGFETLQTFLEEL